jgi:import inner membrane translocase subunit TIM44
LSRLYENFREEMAKNKEMKESLKKFREEAEKLEQSEALKAARQKFETVEKEASKGKSDHWCNILGNCDVLGSEVFKEKFSTIKEKVQGVIDEAGKTEIVKKAGKISEEIGKTTHTISEKAQEISKTGAFQSISEATRAVKQEIDTTSMQGIY